MGSLNKVQLIGNLGRDPEVRYMPNGTPTATISVATSERWKDKGTGEARESVEWHRVVFFRARPKWWASTSSKVAPSTSRAS